MDSYTSLEDNAVLESTKSGKKRKKSTESDFDSVFADAVQSIGKLSSSLANSKTSEKVDEFNEDWLFAKTIYIKMKDVPAGREKDLCRMRINAEVMNLLYGVQNTQTTNSVNVKAAQPNLIPNPMPPRPIIVLKSLQAVDRNNPHE